jgi:GTP-binding protein
MFYDHAKFDITAGKGGDGAISFRREKFIPKGGPDGGDGGKGGDIYFIATNDINILFDFRNKNTFKAQNGQSGSSKDKTGKGGDDLELKIPVGTVVETMDENGIQSKREFLIDGEKVLMARGGNGGWGNSHFATSIKQTPHWAKRGLEGQSFHIELQLMLIADVGMVGFPNAGKSSLLDTISNARPKIANYEFTTTEPLLGVVERKNYRFIVADIPGIIEGAHEGKGLGIEFLKHISRNKVLLYILDGTDENISDKINKLEGELASFNPELLKKNRLIVINKLDLLDAKTINKLKKKHPDAIFISTLTRENIDNLLDKIATLMN